MSTAYRALIYRLFEEVINQGNLALIDILYAPDIVDRNSTDGDLHGRANLRRAIVEIQMLLLNLQALVDNLITDAETVITHATWSGTHIATGKQLQGIFTHIFCIQAGQIIGSRDLQSPFSTTHPLAPAHLHMTMPCLLSPHNTLHLSLQNGTIYGTLGRRGPC